MGTYICLYIDILGEYWVLDRLDQPAILTKPIHKFANPFAPTTILDHFSEAHTLRTMTN